MKLQGEDARFKTQKQNQQKTPLLQNILGPLSDAATLQVKLNAPSSEPYLLNIKTLHLTNTYVYYP